MKRITALLVAIVIVAAAAGCGGSTKAHYAAQSNTAHPGSGNKVTAASVEALIPVSQVLVFCRASDQIISQGSTANEAYAEEQVYFDKGYGTQGSNLPTGPAVFAVLWQDCVSRGY